jgi:hypothetical protein
MRILAKPQRRVGEADAFQHLDRALLRDGRACAGVTAIDGAQLIADREDRVKRRHRLLEDHRHASATKGRELALRHGGKVNAAKLKLLRLEFCATRQKLHQRQRRHRLAATGFAHEAERLAGGNVKVDAAHGAQALSLVGQRDVKIAYG